MYACSGSPPRARGHLGGGPVDVRLLGLTPACAGTSSSATASNPATGAHSPPRARGHLGGGPVDVRLLGLTPACAGTSRRWTGRCTPARAHPRVRGDIIVGDSFKPRDRGSLTPACAGTSCLTALSGCMCRAHPRVRGDIGWEPAYDTVVAGSPPRARGHRDHCDADAALPGLTPACAGTSVVFRKSSARRRAHPRVRGDIRDIERHDCAGTDSSPPRARGHLPEPVTQVSVSGLTPACAGTSQLPRAFTAAAQAHPRVRGDNDGPGGGVRAGRGSPPRARGHRIPAMTEQLVHGLTPACAGTSEDVQHTTDMMPGSPPRARGHHGGRPRSGPGHGLTPACAGTSVVFRKSSARRRAHPRVRGDVAFGFTITGTCGGSPPRARGRRACCADP